MDNFAKCFGYDTDNPAYQAAIQNAQQQGLPEDGSQHPAVNLSLGATVPTMSSHNTAPPQAPIEPAFPTVDRFYDKKAGKAVFTFSPHHLQKQLGHCLLEFWKSSGDVAHKWREGKGGAWELRIKADAKDPRIDFCLYKIRTLMSNCQVLGYTGEKFVAAAKDIGKEKNILNALCEPSITFFRDQNGDVCAIAQADEAINACLDSLLSKMEYEAVYALLASRDAVYLDSNHGPNDHNLNYTIGRMAGLRLISSLQKPQALFISLLAGDSDEHRMLATELLLRSLDRRPDSVEHNVQREIAKIARTFDKKVLDDLYRKHCSEASRLWLHKVCLRSLTLKGDYEAAYNLLTGKDAVFGHRADHDRELIDTVFNSFPGLFTHPLPIESDAPEDHFLYALAQLCLQATVFDRGRSLLTIEFMLRSLDRRPESVDPKAMVVVGWVACTLDEETLNGLYSNHHTAASHLWLRRLMWSRRDGDACRNYYAASRKCRYSLGLMVQEPMKGERLSVDEINQLQDLVLAAVMMDPTSGEFRVACEALDIVYRHASPESAYIIFEGAMMLLEEKRSDLPFDSAKHFLEGLKKYELLKPFALGRTEEALVDDDGDPIVVSDEESS